MNKDSSDMRLSKWFRDEEIALGLFARLEKLVAGMPRASIPIMEVCGTHTVALFRSGIRGRLPQAVRLISGPGCPVCVTPDNLIDKAVVYARMTGFTLATFGDMLRVPGSCSSLEEARADGCDVRIVYSVMDALEMARADSEKTVVFFGVGFETTAPTIAAAIERASEEGLKNFTVVSAHKLVPPALEALCSHPELKLKGFLCPGHVSVIIGRRAYLPIAQKHNIPCVITGFEPLDLLQGIILLCEQAIKGAAEVSTQYSRTVSEDGNMKAKELLGKVFETVDTEWRGIGTIPESGLAIRKEFAAFDAEALFPVEVEPARERTACRCAEVLLGLIEPPQCEMFGGACVPQSPIGACMVSSEGTCAAYYKYSI